MGARQGEEEFRALSWLRFEPDATAVILDDLLARRQADAGARVFVPGVQALKEDEQFAALAGRDADAVIPDRDGDPSVRRRRGEPDHGRFLGAELEGV